MCAAVYIFGKYGDNACPENAVQIRSAEACARAAIFMGLSHPDGNYTAYPQYDQLSGCSADNRRRAFYQFFNRDPTFAARLNPAVRPLCAVGMSSSHSRAPCGMAQRTSRTRSMPRHYRAPTAASLRRAT